MKKFATRLLLLSILVGLIFSGLYLQYPINWEELDRNNYLLSASDKTVGLQKLPGPRLIFTGGSSVAFGIDSKKIGDSLGLQGFNLGLHGLVGPDFMVDQAMALAKPGDVVVISAEYFIPNGEPKMLDYLYDQCPETHGYLARSEKETIPLIYEKWADQLLQKTERIQTVWLRGIEIAKKSDTTGLYKRFGFNDRGDYEYHLNQDFDKKMFGTIKVEPRDFSKQMQALNNLATLRSKGIRVFYLYPCFPEEDFEASKKLINRFRSILEKELQIPILGSPEEFLYPLSTFFDTSYHLKNPGRARRTSQIIRILKDALKQP